MDNQESQFIDSIYAKKGKYDFIVAMLDVDVKEFSKFISKNKEYVEKNKGKIRIDILRTKKDYNKFYCKFTPFIPKKVEVEDHMPDRTKEDDDDGLPF